MAEASGGEEQDKLLNEAFGFVAEQRSNLRKSLDNNDVEMALRYALCLANELRTSRLLPENYYKLYALVFWELQHLAAFVAATGRHDLNLLECYEIVQYEGSVLPRLYMLVTVGAVCIQSDEANGQDILDDLCRMLGAVQHPVRGLFLRYYFLQMVKDKLLKVCGVRGALQVLLSNLRESVSLWMRLRLLEDGSGAVSSTPTSPPETSAHASGRQPQAHPDHVVEDSLVAPTSSLQAPGTEVWSLGRNRQALHMLIGAHMMHIAQMRTFTPELHDEVVLPEMLRISLCEDPPGQAYVLECFVDVFPDAYHLRTLDRVLAACAQLQWVVDLTRLLRRLMQRLTKYLRSVTAAPEELKVDAFTVFHAHLTQLRVRPWSVATPLTSLLELQLELLMVAILLHPGDACRIDLVLSGAVDLVGRRAAGKALALASVRSLISILAAPLTSTSMVPIVLAMPHHETLIAALTRTEWRQAALAMVKAILAGDVSLSDCDTVRRLLALVDPLIHDDSWLNGGGGRNVSVDDAPDSMETGAFGFCEHDGDLFSTEQENIAQLVHKVRHESPTVIFDILKAMRSFFVDGGPYRVAYTLPACLVAALRLAKPIVLEQQAPGAAAGLVGEVFRFARSILEESLPAGVLRVEERLRLWLLIASCAESALGDSAVNLVLIAECRHALGSTLECLHAFPTGGCQVLGLQLLVGTLQQITSLADSEYLALAERAVKFGEGLHSRRSQSQAMSICAHLYWGQTQRYPRRALYCLQGALRMGNKALLVDPANLGLFVDVLEKAVQFYDQGNDEVTPMFLSGLVALCVQHLKYSGGREPSDCKLALTSMLQQLESLAAEDRYAQIKLPRLTTVGDTQPDSTSECHARSNLYGVI